MNKIVMILLLLVSACGTSGDVECGNGEPLAVDGVRYCVYQQSVVVENGFQCPEGLPNLVQEAGIGVCAATDGIPDDRIDDIRDRYRDIDPEYEGCVLDQHCVDSETCSNGTCVGSGTNNNGTNNGSNNGTNNGSNNAECIDNTGCGSEEVCFENMCRAQCGGFGGVNCPSGEFCDWAADDICGAADALVAG